MKKILIILLFFISHCGYQPIYLNKNSQNFEYSKIISEGDSEINVKIINKTSIKETDSISRKLYISSFYEIKNTSMIKLLKVKVF